MNNKKQNLIGFFVSALLHSMIALPLVLASFEVPIPQLETMQIKIDNFVVEDKVGQETKPDETPNIEEEVVEEIVEEIKEEIVEENLEPEPEIKEEIAKIPEPKPKPPKPKEKKKKPIDKNITKIAKKNPVAPISQNTATAQKSALVGPSSKENNYLSTQGAAVESDIRGKIHSIVSAYAQRHYPNAAVRRKQTGVVKVGFHYGRNGQVSNIKIYSSSKYEILDNAVLEAIEKTKKKFPRTDRDLDIKILVKFVLI